MGVVDFILSSIGYTKSPLKKRNSAFARAAFDAAATTKTNSDHWSKTTTSNADAILAAELSTIRTRCRHEMRNNPYAIGLARKFANYAIGVGPTLHVLSDNEEQNDAIEKWWARWCDECDYYGDMTFGERLNLGVRELFPSGEFFDLFVNDDTVKSGVKLRLRMIDSERITGTVTTGIPKENVVQSGIETNGNGIPVAVHMARTHPGSNVFAYSGEYDRVLYENINHVFFRDVPEQTRGYPRLAQMIEIFGSLRRFEEATIRAAEVAALFGAVMVTTNENMIGETPEILGPEEMELNAGTLITAPPGYDIRQVTPQHPSNTHESFKRSKLTDCGAAVDVPYNVLAADSKDHNYASGRLDWQGLVQSIKIFRRWLDRKYCNRVFKRAYKEAMLVEPSLKGFPQDVQFEFRYPGFQHVDVAKEANAAVTLINAGLETRKNYFAERGLDWRSELNQVEIEKKMIGENTNGETQNETA